ncbi:pilus assembly protein N-terminal domain-containing protein [Pseudaestuariivita rosea]|uniref:pilus assembly protein N-terminal domain-containing protein n=1 Tax=Pseudaestuariivita rosea TaxID=2763263 RepID=UPI001ABB283F|nr:pilus assembly protein N-terminal domain-containing protein [Pseudaestuariivita rosea]
MQNVTIIRKIFFVFLTSLCFSVSANAEQLKVFRSDVSRPVSVALGGDVVVKSNSAILEAVIAHPGIANLEMKSASEVKLTGVNEGSTTLTLLDRQANVSQIEVSVGGNTIIRDSVPAPATPRARTISVSFAGTSSTDVHQNGAIVIETTEPFEGLDIANSTVIDGSSISDRSIYIYGKQVGSTTLTLVRHDPSDNTAITVTVTE